LIVVPPSSANSLDSDFRLELLCDEFEAAWRSGEPTSLADFVDRVPPKGRVRLLAELWAIELHYRRDAAGELVGDAGLRELYPQLAELLRNIPVTNPSASGRLTRSDSASSRGTPSAASKGGLHIRCPHCSNPVELLPDAPVDDVSCRSCGSIFSLVDDEGDEREARALERLGRFELLARLGVGGFGTVWKARDTELDRVVAIKIPRKGNLNKGEVEQFMREARAAAQLRHPNIVPVFEVVREREFLFIVSEYVRGMPLSKWTSGPKRTPVELATLCTKLTEALECAHQAGIVHRDLKPSNVMLDASGQPRLMDFGLAKREVGEITMTVDGLILGTPAYMSPEQARGEGHWVDRRSDIYSLGVMLFHLLTHELPFRGSAAMQIQARLTSDPPPPRSLDRAIPIDLATICMKCLEADPNRRYQTAQAVGDELRRFVSGFPIRARPVSGVMRSWKWAQRNPASATALALGAFLAVAGPAATIVLESQRQQIAARLVEREQLVAQQEGEQRQVQKDLAAVRDKLTTITGFTRTAPIDSPRRNLVESFLDARADSLRAKLAVLPPADAATGQEQFGRLLAAADRTDEAISAWTTAFHSIDTNDQSAATRRAALALAIARLQSQTGNTEGASEWIARATGELQSPTAVPVTWAVRTRTIEAAFMAMANSTSAETTQELLQQAATARQQIETEWPDEVSALTAVADTLLGGN
jgi:hypothetical protein